MPYIELDNLISKIPMSFLVEALDDDGDGVVDAEVWQQVQLDVDGEIDGVLGQRFDVPIKPVPPVIKVIARVLAIDAIHLRRGFHSDEDNPWAKQARKMRAKLDDIANSDASLMPGRANDKPQSVKVISEPARMHSKFGNLST